MHYIVILIILVSVKSHSGNILDQKLKTMFTEAKTQIENNCFKCYKGSVQEVENGIKKLETIISNVKDKDSEILSLALETLGDSYGELAGYFNKKNKNKSIDFMKKRGEMYKQAYNASSCPNSDLLIKYFDESQNKTVEEQLIILKPILNQQSNFFKAKYYEGILLIKNGSVDKGLDSLEVAAAIALYKNVLYFGDDIAKILKKHGRNEMAKKILEKKK